MLINTTNIGFINKGNLIMEFVAYFRVSTARQGASGLGIEAQKAAVENYVSSKNGSVIAEFTETESGKNSDRPQLALALIEAKKTGATLLIAKLDRLARNVAFIANLLEGEVEVTAADMPEANRFLLHVMAAVAEHEGKAISERTKAALQAAKARGVKLGWSMPSRRAEQQQASQKGVTIRKAKADNFAAQVLPLIYEIQSETPSLRGIARELNSRNVKTFRGGKWQAITVRNILNRNILNRNVAAA
jgi:DNA invertase Pin-like site-specific DNA recombinase